MGRQRFAGVRNFLRVGRVLHVGESGVRCEDVPRTTGPVGRVAVLGRQRWTQQVGQRFEATGQMWRHVGRLQQKIRHQSVSLGQQGHVQAAALHVLHLRKPTEEQTVQDVET